MGTLSFRNWEPTCLAGESNTVVPDPKDGNLLYGSGDQRCDQALNLPSPTGGVLPPPDSNDPNRKRWTLPQVFTPGEARAIHNDSQNGTPLPHEEPQEVNPPAGVLVYYWLKSVPSGALKVELVDSTGKVAACEASDTSCVSHSVLLPHLRMKTIRVRHTAIHPALIIRTLSDGIAFLTAVDAGNVLRGVSAYSTASIRFDTPSLS
jgi:hypothetical protein